MKRNFRFWRNLTLIALAHVVLIGGLIYWSRQSGAAKPQTLVWMNNGGAGATGDTVDQEKQENKAPTPVEDTPTPEPEKPAPRLKEEDRPVLTSLPSDIHLPAPTVTPTPSVPPRPTPSATPKPTPKPKPSPKATPKPTPKPTPTPKPKPKPTPKKTVVAKASPKPSAKPREESDEDKKSEEEDAATQEKKKMALAALNKAKEGESPAPKKSAGGHNGTGETGAGGPGGKAGGGAGESQFGWYGAMLHDRFHGEWVQPSLGAKASVLVQVRIEKDGHISHFEIVKPSGIQVLDDSVSAVAKRVTEVDPLPPGLGNGGHYDVKINFEFTPDQ